MSETGDDPLRYPLSLGPAGGAGEGGRVDEPSDAPVVYAICHALRYGIRAHGEELDRAERALWVYESGLYARQACPRSHGLVQFPAGDPSCCAGPGGRRAHLTAACTGRAYRD